MGNTILRDDGAGIHAVRRLAELLLARGATPVVPGPPDAHSDAGTPIPPGPTGQVPPGTGQPQVTSDVTALALPDGRQVHLAEACTGGLGLVEIMLGYSHAVVIDAWPGVPPGQFTVLSIADLGHAPAPASGHQMGLPAAMRAADRLGLPLPDHVELWAIGVQDLGLGEMCTPPVQAAVEEVAGRLATLLTGHTDPGGHLRARQNR
ncbi:MAG: hydrogenase maturation protease [Firmicutes bacterium]|nr:hydrogenase maturation protease [Bacillota bacterium]